MQFTVRKDDLITQLRDNRKEHLKAYQEALVLYRRKALAFFEEAMDKIRDGGEVERFLRLPLPEEHTEDFDRTIDALKWHTEETIVLNENQFEELVRNNWGWHKTFMANTTSYLAS